MSRYTHATERDVYRALVVDAQTDVAWDEYIKATSQADPTTLADVQEADAR